MEEINNILPIMFPIGFILAVAVGIIAFKNNWRIVKWF
jgi:hypothetical protein